jgi:hypothetical protein
VIIIQGETSPSQEKSVCTRETSPSLGNKKGYKNPISNLTHRTLSFWVPLHAPMLESASAFNLKVDPRTLNSWEFLWIICVSIPSAQMQTCFKCRKKTMVTSNNKGKHKPYHIFLTYNVIAYINMSGPQDLQICNQTSFWMSVKIFLDEINIWIGVGIK